VHAGMVLPLANISQCLDLGRGFVTLAAVRGVYQRL
jgi:hypothetical protein